MGSGRLGVVATGGTIAAEARGSQRRLAADRGEAAAELELVLAADGSLRANDCVAVSPVRVLSEDLVPADWAEIATAIRRLVEDRQVTQVLVLHGTDTMSYTAAALSYLLADLGAPIVLTGANVPPGEPESDALENVHDSLIALRSLPAGTYVTFAGSPDLPGWVHLGTRVHKACTSGQAFFSCGRSPVAKILGETFVPLDLPAPPAPVGGARCALDDRVLAVRLVPGIDLDAVSETVADTGARGVVVELYASGTGPTRGDRHSLPRFVRACAHAGALVVTTSPASVIERSPRRFAAEYPSLAAARAVGAIFLGDTLVEAATAKLMWALAQRLDAAGTRSLVERCVVQETALHAPA